MHHTIGLIVMGEDACKDFKIFVQTLQIWHPDAELFVYTDSSTKPHLHSSGLTMHTKCALDRYTGLNRKTMESMDGTIYKTLWTEFMYEKTNVIDWIFSMGAKDVWFLDADITFLAPLPSVPPTAKLALSPHYIREADCKLYGKYNGGFMFFREQSLLDAWRSAGHTSRFYEQAPLETIASLVGVDLYEFPIQVNFGWWRMFQSSDAPPTIQQKFSIFRGDTSVGIRYDGIPLQSIHGHWYDSSSANGIFNTWFRSFLLKFKSHAPLRRLYAILGHN